MKENTEKVVVIFDRIDKTAITVIESLGGEIQKQKAVKDEQHPLIGKWVKCVEPPSSAFTRDEWYLCVRNPDDVLAFLDNDGEPNGKVEKNNVCFNLTDARDYNPDEVKALVGKLVKHKQSGEYHEFVESDDPRCEVEGVAVKTLRLTTHIYEKKGDQYVMYNNYDLKDFKEKEVELLVPDNVKFYDWGGDIALEVSEGIFLVYDKNSQAFILLENAIDNDKLIEAYPIKCKLVPVKYEDVQVGDFVVLLANCKDLIEQYSMKHGDKKFCGMLYDGSFTFNKDWYSSSDPLLKVVRC